MELYFAGVADDDGSVNLRLAHPLVMPITTG